MSRKSKGECTCKIVAQNERGMLRQVRDSVYRGVKYCGDGGQVEKMFRFPRKLSEEKWLEWLDADLTEDELRILEPLNRKQRRVAKRANEHNAKQLKCYAIMATAQGGVKPAMVLTDERDAYDMCAALEAAGAVLTEKVSYEVVETILRH